MHYKSRTSETTDDVCKLLRAGRPRGPVIIAFRPENIVNNREVLAALALPSVSKYVPFEIFEKEYKLHRSPVVLFAIDEAHCGVCWGQTFIQEWGQLGKAAGALSIWTCGHTPMLLMTATFPPAARGFDRRRFSSAHLEKSTMSCMHHDVKVFV